MTHDNNIAAWEFGFGSYTNYSDTNPTEEGLKTLADALAKCFSVDEIFPVKDAQYNQL